MTLNETQLEQVIADRRARVEDTLQACLPNPDAPPQTLHAAMRYAVLGQGKRVRPLLVYAAGEAIGAPMDRLDAPAAAVELMHAYSLVHDDLPAMDDDDLRRGQPTCHRQFDEATAILAGDALQALAFGVLTGESRDGEESARRLRMVARLAAAAGSAGMAGGQALDLALVGRATDLDTLERMHRLKTGALIEASVDLGALAAPTLSPAQREALATYAAGLGLAFQIQDDVLDVTGETAELGKRGGADRARNKPTYPELLGLDAARLRAETLYGDAVAALDRLDATRSAMLHHLARLVVQRTR